MEAFLSIETIVGMKRKVSLFPNIFLLKTSLEVNDFLPKACQHNTFGEENQKVQFETDSD